MTQPHICATCVTFGRVEKLSEAIAMFQAQDYANKSMIVLNTFPDQKLEYPNAALNNVMIVNLDERPTSLGYARNKAVLLAPDNALITTWDDDDAYLPNHLSNFARNYDQQDNWVWLDKEFYSEGGRIKSIVQGTPNTFAFTKAAWKSVSGYRSLTVGEDRVFIGLVTSKVPGHREILVNHEISFIRGFDNGVYHVSGNGEDNGGKTAHDRMSEWVAEQVRKKAIPTGTITIEPKCSVDWSAQAAAFVTGMAGYHNNRRTRAGILILGRYGDILNILPVSKHIHDKYGKPLFFVARQFADVLDGVSYVEPVVMDLAYDDIKEAIKQATPQCGHLLSCQVWGKNWRSDTGHPVYNVESWRLAGFLNEFWDFKGFPLVIDRRNLEREVALCDTLPLAGKPVILVNVGGGTSSPFPRPAEFFEAIKQRWQNDFMVLEISQLNAHRIFDLLSLFEKAALLITSDTATLHLAAAVDIPVIALVNGLRWGGTEPRLKTLMTLKYEDSITPQGLGMINAIINLHRCNLKEALNAS